jgi:hypothetical protein
VPADSVPDVDWVNGLPLHRATELLAPEAWAQDALLHFVRSGRIELRTLHPRANPEGKFIRLSSDIVSALIAPDVDLEHSTIRLPDGSTWPVRAFLPRQQAAEVTPNPQNIDAADAEPLQRIPVKLRIADAFDRLTDDERALVDRHGGVKKLEHILQRALPDVPLPTLQRALRRFRRERSG